MTIIHIIGIAIALAMDAFAVSIATGITLKRVNKRQKFRLTWHFGLFQALMPVIGWLMGRGAYSVVEKYDHWIAFILLFLVGAHMIKEYFSETEAQSNVKDPTKGITLVMLSFATSIDALAIGFSMSMLSSKIILPAIVIGIVASLFTFVGLHLGSKFGIKSKLSSYAQVIGGVGLIFIGINILYNHGALTF